MHHAKRMNPESGNRQHKSQRLFRAFACSACVWAGMGCVKVDAQRDFQDASRQIAERTGASTAYDPADESFIQSRVKTLLEAGLTIDEAVSVALLNNPAFQADFLAIGASRADVVQSGLFTNPNLFFSVRFPEAGGRSNLGFSLAQQLVDLWQIPVRKEVAEADLARMVTSVLDHGVRLAADVRIQCIEVLAWRRAEQIAVENLEITQRAQRLAQIRLDAGETDETDVNLVSSHAFEVEQLLIGIRRDLAAAQLDLASTLGLVRWPDTWTLVGTLEAESASDAATDNLLQFARNERFDVRVAESQVSSAEAQLEREYLQIFPSLVVGLEAERKDRRALPGRDILGDTARASIAAGAPTAPTIQSRGQRDLIRRQIIDSLLGPSVQVTLPLWDQNQAQIAKSRFTVIQSRKQLESVLDRMTREVRQARVKADAAREMVHLVESKSLPRAKQNVEIIRRQYENGEQSILFFLESQEFLLHQGRAYVDALRASALANAELTRSLGGRRPPVTTSGPSPIPLTTQEEFNHAER